MKQQQLLTYEAYFIKENDDLFSVYFPDVEGCCSDGHSLAEAISNATEALSLALFDENEKTGLAKDIPEATKHSAKDLEDFCKNILECNEVPEGSLILPVSFNPTEYYKKNYFNTIKKTLTIPQWLNDTAIDAGINFSKLLVEAIKQKLKEREQGKEN